MNKRFELSFWGGVDVRFKRFHAELEAAKSEALRVLAKLSNRGAHPAIIYEGNKQVLSVQ